MPPFFSRSRSGGLGLPASGKRAAGRALACAALAACTGAPPPVAGAGPEGGGGSGGRTEPGRSAPGGASAASDAGATADSGSGAQADARFAADARPPEEPPTHSLYTGRFLVPPGEEVSDSVGFELGNESPVWIRRMAWSSTAGLHHGRLEAPRPGLVHAPIFGVSTFARDTTRSLPEGHALFLPARQPLVINYHYLNTDTAAIDGEVRVDLWELHEGETPPVPTAMFFLEVGAFEIPAGSERSAEARCAFTRDVRISSLVSHTHELGRGVDIYRGVEEELVYTTDEWSDPPWLDFDPPLTWKAGEPLRVVCRWQNTTASAVAFGPTAKDEMCVIAGYFSPAAGPLEVLVNDGETSCTLDPDPS